MTTVSQTPGYQPPRTAAAPPGDPPLTLADEHALLLSQVLIRAEDLLAVTAEDRWPARELQVLVGYLRAEVLGQDADEERLLFPAGAPPGVSPPALPPPPPPPQRNCSTRSSPATSGGRRAAPPTTSAAPLTRAARTT
jgi:hypothetical protein